MVKYRIQLVAKNPAKHITWVTTAKSVRDLATMIAKAYPGCTLVSAEEL